MKFKYGLLFVLCVSFNTLAQPIPTLMHKVQHSTQLKKQVCEIVESLCDQAHWQLYQDQQTPNQYYLIQDLKLYAFKRKDKKIQLENAWDFSHYQTKQIATHWTTEEVDQPSDHRHIYPALFKISEHSHAIAVIQRFTESYSGGAMTEEVADFLELQAKGQFQPKFSNIPFSVQRMIRACFSAEDYERAGDDHCHDYENLVLNMAYTAPYAWQMKYHYYRELSPVSDQKPLNQRLSFQLDTQKHQAIHFPATWTRY